MDQLHRFGCKAIYFRAQQRSKLALRGITAMFVGYDLTRTHVAYVFATLAHGNWKFVSSDQAIFFDDSLYLVAPISNFGNSGSLSVSFDTHADTTPSSPLSDNTATSSTTPVTSETRDTFNFAPETPQPLTHQQQTSHPAQPEHAQESTPDADAQSSKHKRVRRPTDHGPFISHLSQNFHLPRTAAEAKRDPKWRAAMETELKTLNSNSTFEWLNQIPHHAIAVPLLWVFKIKDDGTYKARCAVRGDKMPSPPRSSLVNWAPVATLTSRRIAIILGLSLGYLSAIFDIVAAFTEAELRDVQIFVSAPPGFPHRGKYARLKKSLYGLCSASKRWHIKISCILKTIGLKPLTADPCIFISDESPPHAIISLHVDDGHVLAKTHALKQKIRTALSSELKLKWHDDFSQLLGSTVSSKEPSTAIVHHGHLSTNLAKVNGHKLISDEEVKGTPFSPTVYSDLHSMIQMPAEPAATQLAQSLVGTVSYLARESRPDLSFIANLLSRYVSKANSMFNPIAKRLIRYIARTATRGLLFTATTFPVSLIACVDADLGNDPDSERSTSGYILSLNNIGPANLISWKSKLQTITATGAMIAEAIAVETCAKEVLFIRSILQEMHILRQGPCTIYCDCAPAIAMLNAGTSSNRRTKYLSLKLRWVHEEIAKGTICLKKIATDANPADFLTKAVRPELFKKHANATTTLA
jgi:hypothetical protein